MTRISGARRVDTVPRVDREPAGPFEPREVAFEFPRRVQRRGFLAVMATAAMTLGVTALSWVPLARPARAEPGTEYLGCGQYSDGPGGPLCTGYPYSTDYCGDDDWFRNGCFETSDGHTDCYQPLEICEADEGRGRNAWRWQTDDAEWRCADGEVEHEGAPNPERVICSAQLSSTTSPDESPDQPEPSPLLPPIPTVSDTSSLPTLGR